MQLSSRSHWLSQTDLDTNEPHSTVCQQPPVSRLGVKHLTQDFEAEKCTSQTLNQKTLLLQKKYAPVFTQRNQYS